MEELETALASSSNCRNWFDVAACCYSLIKENLELANETEEGFISTYIDFNPDAQDNNPNRNSLKAFIGKAKDVIENFQNHSLSFDNALRNAMDNMHDCKLLPFQDNRLNVSTLVWSLIVAIDSAYYKSALATKSSRPEPLNNNATSKGIAVYFIFQDSPILQAISSKRLRRIPENTLQRQLKTLIFYQNKQKKAFPRIVRIAGHHAIPSGTTEICKTDQIELQDTSIQAAFAAAPRLRIGSCPFTSIQLSGFDPSFPITFPRPLGSTFTVKYHEEIDSYFDSIIWPAVNTAVETDCQILLFPEIVFAPSFHKRLKNALEHTTEKGSLSLIVAGSTWDSSLKTNTSSFYDRNGNYLGCHFKKQPFFIGSGEKKLTEYLSQPDSPDTLVDIPGIGRVAAAICKDIISDQSDIFRDIDILAPQIVCIPAFSTSVQRGFIHPVQMLAERYLTISCVTYYCAQRMDNSPTLLGYICCPGSNAANPSTRVQPIIEPLEINECANDCTTSSSCSCLEIIDIDYESNVKTTICPVIATEKHRL